MATGPAFLLNAPELVVSAEERRRDVHTSYLSELAERRGATTDRTGPEQVRWPPATPPPHVASDATRYLGIPNSPRRPARISARGVESVTAAVGAVAHSAGRAGRR